MKYQNEDFEDEYEDFYSDDQPDWEEETWWALTDGMYGDYLGPGVDYDFLGF
ncbi:MAG: hypothetical protein IKW82_07610 [Bacteroidales bacterium]|nr:hypothetical protein [Bacteroidales bacterium]